MKNKSISIIAFCSTLLFSSCKPNEHAYDASGAFEAEEVIISSEASGTIKELDIREGQSLQAGQHIGYIDSTQLWLRKKQLEAQIQAVESRKPEISTQLASLREQLAAAQKEQQRISNMVQADAATPKQLDDINAQVNVLKKQIAAQRSSLGISSESIGKEAQPLLVQIEQVNDQLQKSRIVNPVAGTVLTKYAEANEVAAPGKPLYKVADLSALMLRAYITGSQLSQIKLNQKMEVLVDEGPDSYKTYKGTIVWISDKAEFTPKTIQTKEERANLVYPIKIRVDNDGYLKLGMYADVRFL